MKLGIIRATAGKYRSQSASLLALMYSIVMKIGLVTKSIHSAFWFYFCQKISKCLMRSSVQFTTLSSKTLHIKSSAIMPKVRTFSGNFFPFNILCTRAKVGCIISLSPLSSIRPSMHPRKLVSMCIP